MIYPRMMHIIIIAAFVILFLREPLASGGAAPLLRELGPGWSAAAALAMMGWVWLVAHIAVLHQLRRMDRGRRGTILWADRAIFFSRVAALGVHAFNIFALGWLDVIRSVTGDTILIDEFLAVLPLLLVLIGGWWTMYPVERRVREAMLIRDLEQGRPVRPLPTRASHVFSTARHQAAMVVVPVLIILSWREVVEFAAARDWLPEWIPVLGLQFAGAVVALMLMPLVLRRVWDTIDLEAGPLRDDLVAMCREHRVRVRRVLLWRTDGTMINGAVLGLIGPARYVMLTDALLEMLPGEQVRAVMAHELGHIRRWHMPWLAGAALGGIILASATLDRTLLLLSPEWYHTSAGQTAIILGGMTLGLVIFGFASRRFEWQADAFAVQHLSGWRGRRDQRQLMMTPEAVEAMADALGAVAALNHIAPARFTWRHGSIASRQRRLRALVGRPAGRLKPDRDAALVKLVIAAGVGVVLAMLVLGLVH